MSAQTQKARFILPVALAIALSAGTGAAWTGFGDNVEDPADLTPMMLQDPVAANASHIPAAIATTDTAMPVPAINVPTRLASTAKCSGLNPCAVVAPAIDHIAPERRAQASGR